MSLKKNLLYSFILSISQVAFPLLSIPYISRILSPEGIGRVGFIDSLTYYFIVIAEFGIVTYGIREVTRKSGDARGLQKLVSELLSLHVFTSVISICIYLLCLFVFYRQVEDIRLIFFSLSFLLVNAFYCEWYFWGTEKFQYITIRSLITRILGLVSIFLIVNDSGDYIIYYAIITGTAAINLLWNFFRLSKEVGLSLRNLQWQKHFSAVSVTYRISLVYSVVIMLDNVFLQLLSTSVAVAYYMFAAKIVRIAGALVTDTLLVMYPRTVYQAHKNEMEALRATVQHSAQIIVLTTIPMAVGMFLLSEKLTQVYFGPNFLPLADNLKILSFYPFLKAFGLFLNKQLLMPFDKEKLVLRSLTVGMFVFVLSTIPLSYYFADKGMCLSIMLSELTVVIMNVVYVRESGIGIPKNVFLSVLHAFLGALFFFPVVYFTELLSPNAWVQLIIAIFLCVVLYFFFLVLIGNSLALQVFNLLRQNLFKKRLYREG
ncbi:MAG TPA: oligosaccharide flippase family protein [Flavisolibacter sp.]|nr:oligosaccharide flippase family protein [Flavisolibacter sp.]